MPFGAEIPGGWAGRGSQWGAVDNVYQRFTGQERDSETGMDFFQARYFGSALGRFISPDDPFAGQDVSDPQSWNLYSYVLNNPLRYTDPDGHEDEDNSNGVPTFRATGTGYSGLSPLDELLYRSFLNSLNTALQQTQQMGQQALDWVSAPRDPGCMQKAAVLGAGAGAVIGGAAGGFGGGAVGGVAGSIVPVAGTAAGLAGGASLGIAGGASLGGAIGYAGGLAIGFTACISSSGGSRSPVLSRDATGKVHGKLPDHVPDSWVKQDLEEAAEELQQSIKTRQQEQLDLGEDGPHRVRIGQEEKLLRQILKKLSGS